MSWLQRVFTLPKAHNSLSDLIGADAAHMLTQTFHALVANTVATALHAAVSGGEAELVKIGVQVAGALSGVLQGVSPALATEIGTAVNIGIKNAEAAIEANIPAVVDSVVKEIGVLLKIA